MKATIRKLFLGGLVAVLPLVLTAYILYWIGSFAEGLFGRLLRTLLSEKHYVPGMGLIVGVVVVFAIGVLIHLWFIRSLFAWGNRLLNRIPLVKTLYGSMRDMMGYFGGSDEKAMDQVAMVSLGDGDARVLGVVTRTQFADLPDGIGTDEEVAVYVPLSYAMGGFTIIVPRSKVRPIDMPFQEAMRFAVTAGMSSKEQPPPGGASG